VAVLSRQALRAPETFDAWLDAFRRAVTVQPHGDLPPCPNCGRFDLQVRFVADPATRIGSAAMWSDFCGHGIRVSRIEVPVGTSFLPTDAPSADLASYISSFIEIGPSGPIPEPPAHDVGDPHAKVLRLLRRQGPLTVGQIVAEIDLSPGLVEQVVERLASQGVVTRHGARRDVIEPAG
jgi:hypothetical protein